MLPTIGRACRLLPPPRAGKTRPRPAALVEPTLLGAPSALFGLSPRCAGVIPLATYQCPRVASPGRHDARRTLGRMWRLPVRPDRHGKRGNKLLKSNPLCHTYASAVVATIGYRGRGRQVGRGGRKWRLRSRSCPAKRGFPRDHRPEVFSAPSGPSKPRSNGALSYLCAAKSAARETQHMVFCVCAQAANFYSISALCRCNCDGITATRPPELVTKSKCMGK